MRRILISILCLQIVTVGIALSSFWGFELPVFRQIIFFLYLTFCPGLIILIIAGVRVFDKIEYLLYTVGLSIAVTIFTTLLANITYPIIGISRPISFLTLYLTISIFVVILSVIAYFRGKHELILLKVNAKLLSPQALFLLLLPLISAIGAQVMNANGNNILLLVMIVIICLVAILISFGRFIPPELYPFAIFMIGMSLLFHQSLITNHTWGWDIQFEYYYQNQVIINGIWSHSVFSNLNTMLSTTMLAPAYSLLLDMNSVWVFKIIFPMIYSLVPLALFKILRLQLSDLVAFMAVFFFMSYNVYFAEMMQLPRQQIAEFFLVTSILVLVSEKIRPFYRSCLLVIFGFCMVVSHYGTSYIYMMYLIISILILKLLSSAFITNLMHKILDTHGKSFKEMNTNIKNSNFSLMRIKSTKLSGKYVLIILVFGIAWYSFVGSGSALISVVDLGTHIGNSISEIFNPMTRDRNMLLAIGLASPGISSVQRDLFRLLQYLTELFIIIGVVKVMIDLRKTHYISIYNSMGISSTVLLLMSIILPFFASALNITRIYHLTLFFLAPSFVLGSIIVFRFIIYGLKRFKGIINEKVILRSITLTILIPYFLFNTGFIFQLTNDVPVSIALNSEFDYPRYNHQEVSGAKWVSFEANPEMIYADSYGSLLLDGFLGSGIRILSPNKSVEKSGFIFLRSWNVEKSEILTEIMTGVQTRWGHIYINETSQLSQIIKGGSLVYNNGKAKVIIVN